MKTMKPWSRLPSQWVLDGGLKAFTATPRAHSDTTAAPMVLMAVAHNTSFETGAAEVTYTTLEAATGISRAKISAGLALLEQRGVIARKADGRSHIRFVGDKPWMKIPARQLYDGVSIRMFKDFRLRSVVEADALKVLFLLAAFRRDETNQTYVGYEKIEEKTGIPSNRIQSAISFLVALRVLHVEPARVALNGTRLSAVYRIAHIDPNAHAGTAPATAIDVVPTQVLFG